MRQIALDTETTGLSTELGHRIIEIGCVEMVNRKLTGNTFHYYVHPEREVDPGAFAVHGIGLDFLSDKPKFVEIFKPLLEFINGAELIIHNAPFDVGFLNHEFSLLGHQNQINHYCSVFDTLPFARKQHPGQKNNLDALCKRYTIDNSHRNLHGALLDAELLARLYLAMTGGQATLFAENTTSSTNQEGSEVFNLLERNKPLVISEISEQEKSEHLQFVEILKKSGTNLWEE
jgi:DNA polymerase-3 subunit epsilon